MVGIANDFMRIGIAQLNPRIGDVKYNLSRAKQTLTKADRENIDILLFSELFISGYSPEDLVLKPAFLLACEKAIEELAAFTKQVATAAVIGVPVIRNGLIFNAVVVLDKGEIVAERHKIDLPNYAEFDEKRIFSPGAGELATTNPVTLRGWTFGLPICEDIWNDATFCKKLVDNGAKFLLVANASPYSQNKPDERLAAAKKQAINSGVPLVYANQVCGQDELMFDGGSFALDEHGDYVSQARHFAEDLAISDWQKSNDEWHCIKGEVHPLLRGEEADYTACMLALRDYVLKNGFKKIVLGQSGGIDSALCTAIAVDALGAENVEAIMLPYHYTSSESLDDAAQCVKALDCSYKIVPIEQSVEATAKILAPVLEDGLSFDEVKAAIKQGKEAIWLENLQSRIRGVFLMAVSNKTGAMLVTTGNKSEMAVGFATLYGDMNGGFNPIKDVYKMQVYGLSRWRNNHHTITAKGPKGQVIPTNIIDKAPSAELSEGQKDEDRLPAYPVLDAILHGLIEEDLDCAAIIAKGYSPEVVERVERLLYIAEYKRRQSAPGVKITKKPFGKVRRYPIANGFKTRLNLD